MTLLISVEAHFGDDYKENNQKPQIDHDYVVQELDNLIHRMLSKVCTKISNFNKL